LINATPAIPDIISQKSKNPPKRVFSDLVEVPSIAVLAMVDLPDPERVLRFRVGAD